MIAEYRRVYIDYVRNFILESKEFKTFVTQLKVNSEDILFETDINEIIQKILTDRISDQVRFMAWNILSDFMQLLKDDKISFTIKQNDNYQKLTN